MNPIVRRLKENRDIQTARELVESAGYHVSKKEYDDDAYDRWQSGHRDQVDDFSGPEYDDVPFESKDMEESVDIVEYKWDSEFTIPVGEPYPIKNYAPANVEECRYIGTIWAPYPEDGYDKYAGDILDQEDTSYLYGGGAVEFDTEEEVKAWVESWFSKNLKESNKLKESAVEEFQSLITDDAVLDTMKKISADLGIDTDSLPTEKDARRLLKAYKGGEYDHETKAPSRNDDSTREEKVVYAKKLLQKAKSGGDVDAAWKLIDFLWDTELLKESTKVECKRIKESLSSEIIFQLRKLSTEANEALYQYEELNNLRECRDILYYLVRDSKETLEYIKSSL